MAALKDWLVRPVALFLLMVVLAVAASTVLSSMVTRPNEPAMAHHDGGSDAQGDAADWDPLAELARRGVRCAVIADQSTGSIPPWALQSIQAEAIRSGGPGNWLRPLAQRWDSGQGWIGDLPDAAVAFGGHEIRSENGGTWIVTDQPVSRAVFLRAITLPNGWRVWMPLHHAVATSCPSPEP
jgi:hypothetical protein